MTNRYFPASPARLQRLCWGLALATLTFSTSSLQAQEQCRMGLHYQMPTATVGAKGFPVLSAIVPYSPASRAGLQAGDVITAIDGISTEGRSSREISELLVRPVAEHLLTIERLGAGSQTRLLHAYCRAAEAITERELAQAFAGYSQQDATSQALSYPFTFHTAGEVAWGRVQTFAFAPSSPGSEAIDRAIYAQVARLLEARGLRQVTTSADLLIEAFYSLQPSSDGRQDAQQPTASLRYTPGTTPLQVLPLLPPTSTAGSAYDLQFSLQISSPARPSQPVVWSCEARERLSEAMTLPAYTEVALPVMLQAFPYAPRTTPARYHYEALRYLYTGIVYDTRDLSRIADVDDGSPAFRAGLRTGDRLLSINGKRFGLTDPRQLSSAYQAFLSETFRLRQTSELAPNLRPWESKSYGAVRKALEKSPEATIFSYLFFFRPYVNDSEHTLLLVDIERAGQTYSLSITPELRDESTLIPD